MKYKIAYIEWVDPTFHSNENIDKNWDFIKQITCGLVVKEDDKHIRIALNMDETKVGEFIDIPKCLITKKITRIWKV